MAYIYQADVWCEECGESIRAELRTAGKAPEDEEDEYSYDSDGFPKRYDAESSESDTPENCTNCHEFLRNQLTSEGYRYVKEMLDGHGQELPDHAREWAEFYEFSWRPAECPDCGLEAEEGQGRCPDCQKGFTEPEWRSPEMGE